MARSSIFERYLGSDSAALQACRAAAAVFAAEAILRHVGYRSGERLDLIKRTSIFAVQGKMAERIFVVDADRGITK
jgi:hypothetical protein